MLIETREDLGTWYSLCGSPFEMVFSSSWTWVLPFCSLYFPPFVGALVYLWLAGFHQLRCFKAYDEGKNHVGPYKLVCTVNLGLVQVLAGTEIKLWGLCRAEFNVNAQGPTHTPNHPRTLLTQSCG
jgi:hypothetical protein